MERPQKEFGDYLKEYRRRKGVTLQQVAERLGVSLSLISDIENKRRNPLDEEEKMEVLAQYLDLSIEEKELLYDMAAKKRNSVPEDLKEVIMYDTCNSDYVRKALRKIKSGEITTQQLKNFVDGGDDGT